MKMLLNKSLRDIFSCSPSWSVFFFSKIMLKKTKTSYFLAFFGAKRRFFFSILQLFFSIFCRREAPSFFLALFFSIFFGAKRRVFFQHFFQNLKKTLVGSYHQNATLARVLVKSWLYAPYFWKAFHIMDGQCTKFQVVLTSLSSRNLLG